MKKNYLYNLILSLVNILFPILSFPYVSRVIGPTGIGKVQFITSFAQYFAIVAALGIPIYGIREVAKYKHDKKALSAVSTELFIIYISTSVLLSILYFGVIFLFPYFREDQGLYLAAGFLVLLAFSSLDWFFAGLEEFKSIALRSIAVKVISLLLLYLFVNDAGDYKEYLFITMFSLLGNNLISLAILLKKIEVSRSSPTIKKHIRPLLLIFSTTVATSLYTVLDTVLLGFLADPEAVGLYTAAAKLSKITIPFLTSMGIVFIPQLTKKLFESRTEDVNSLINKSFSFNVFFSIPIVVGLYVLSTEFITVFSGEEFLPAVPAMQILSVLPFAIGMGYLFGYQMLVAAGKDKELLYSVIGGVVMSLFLNFLLVPHLREVGSAIASVSSELIVTITYFYFVQRNYALSYSWGEIARAAISAALFIPAIIWIKDMEIHIIARLIASIALASGIYLAVQYFIFKNAFLREYSAHFLSKLKKGGAA